MWPFFRRRAVELPPWSYAAMADDVVEISPANGNWSITDGAIINRFSISMPAVSGATAFVSKRKPDSGFSSFQFKYQSDDINSIDAWHEIVIDSGEIVLCADTAFSEEALPHRTRYQIIRSVGMSHHGADVVVLSDIESKCIALLARPPKSQFYRKALCARSSSRSPPFIPP